MVQSIEERIFLVEHVLRANGEYTEQEARVFGKVSSTKSVVLKLF